MIILLIQHVPTLFFLLKRTKSNSNLQQIILYKELSQDERKKNEGETCEEKHIYLTLNVNG